MTTDLMPGALLGMRALHAEVHSARPLSPVVPDRPDPRGAGPTARARARAATALTRLAEWVRPADNGAVVCEPGRR